ncbi:MAG: type II toxin-antitoxin system VapC family toxin, partial [Spirochaetia bacterium]
GNQVFLSSASCWEIVIKYSLGRLDIPSSPDNFILDEIQANSFTVLSISPPHVFELLNLPDIHSDPFDRILIAQSINERIHFLTNDAAIERYNVECVW